MIFTTGGTIDSQMYNACIMHRKGYISSQIPGKFLHTLGVGMFLGMFLHTFGVGMFLAMFLHTFGVGMFLHT